MSVIILLKHRPPGSYETVVRGRSMTASRTEDEPHVPSLCR